MELDLRIHIENWNDHGEPVCFNSIDLEREGDLFNMIRLEVDLSGYKIDSYKFNANGEMPQKTDDKYGDPIYYLKAKDFKMKPENKFNQAVFAFFRALEPDTKVILYWN